MDDEDHKKTANYLMAAAVHHFQAASHYENGNHEKAYQSAHLAEEYVNLANANTSNA